MRHHSAFFIVQFNMEYHLVKWGQLHNHTFKLAQKIKKDKIKIDLILADNKDARNTLDTHERRIERFEEQVYTATSS